MNRIHADPQRQIGRARARALPDRRRCAPQMHDDAQAADAAARLARLRKAHLRGARMAVRPDDPGARRRFGVHPDRAVVRPGDRGVSWSSTWPNSRNRNAHERHRRSSSPAPGAAWGRRMLRRDRGRSEGVRLLGSLRPRRRPAAADRQGRGADRFHHVPQRSVELAALAAQARIVHVIGTTGFSAEDDAKIRAAARHAVIVKSGNMSLGVNSARRAGEAGGEGAARLRRRDRRDASSQQGRCASGTPVLGSGARLRCWANGVGRGDERRRMTASLRGGTVVGEHQVILAGPQRAHRAVACRRGPRDLRARRAGRGEMGPGQEARPLRDGGRARPFLSAPLPPPASRACASTPQ